ncbi:DNA mismatch repair protein MSH5 [Usnea florida]
MASSLSRPIIVLGALLLAHACYSAHEHAALHTKSPQQSAIPSSKNTQSSSVALPLDVSIETILSVVFICVGLVLGAEELKPISWRVWAGKTERESGGGGPFQGLEDRLGFVDIRKKREDFADWVRSSEQ